MLRRQIRHAWVSGQYSSLKDLSRAFSIPIERLKLWREEEDWDAEKQYVDLLTQKRIRSSSADSITKLNKQHDRIWSAFDHQIYLYMKEATSQGKMLNPKVMDVLSKVFERSQKGRRTARGADTILQITQQGTQDKIEIVYTGLEHAIAAAKEKLAEDASISLSDVSIPLPSDLAEKENDPERLIEDINRENREAIARAEAQKKSNPKKSPPSSD
jgi:hypothetical protein